MKKNFLAGAELPDFADLGPAARIWLDTVANVRIHGETRQKPVDRLKGEIAHIHTLPLYQWNIIYGKM